jgi:hypothetical protein
MSINDIKNERRKVETRYHSRNGAKLKSHIISKKINIIKMKKTLILVTMLLTFGFLNAQKIYSESVASRADVKVYVETVESRADLLVYKEDVSSRATGNDGVWYFESVKSRADKSIYFEEVASRADLIICFTNVKSRAGWKNSAKKSLMY